MENGNLDIQNLGPEGKLDLIITLLQGNRLDKKDNGLIGRVADLETETEIIKTWRDKTIAWAIGFSFGGGALVSVLITLLLTHKK